VRLALGAGRELILRLVLGRGLRLAALGVLLGSGLALATTRLLRTLLFGVAPADPLAFAVAAALLPLVALAASLIPAWRATRVDPMAALRSE
jgi:putative ABC transport system permease protein